MVAIEGIQRLLRLARRNAAGFNWEELASDPKGWARAASERLIADYRRRSWWLYWVPIRRGVFLAQMDIRARDLWDLWTDQRHALGRDLVADLARQRKCTADEAIEAVRKAMREGNLFLMEEAKPAEEAETKS